MNKKTIAFILKGYPRLSETFILNEILLLEKLGYKLHIFAMRNPGESKIHDGVRRVQAKVTYIPDYFWPHFFAFIISNLRCFLKKPTTFLPAFRFAVWRSISRWDVSTLKRFAQAAYFIDRCLPGTDIAHLHSHFSHDPTTMTYFASILTGLNYSFSAHAKDIYAQDQDFLKMKIDHARFVVTCTGFNKTHLQQLAPSNVPVHRCYHGINLDFYSPSKKIKTQSRPQILSIGRLVPKKGFPVLIKALHLLKQSGVNFCCTIVGSGPMKDELTALIARLDLTEDVCLRTEMSQGELFKYYQSANVFALASQVLADGDRDGIPNVIVEAMAMKIPIVATRISGIPECVDHEVNGILVEQKNSMEFAKALEKILVNAELAEQYGAAARKKVETLFDASRNINLIGDALSRELNGKYSDHSLKTVAKKIDSTVAI